MLYVSILSHAITETLWAILWPLFTSTAESIRPLLETGLYLGLAFISNSLFDKFNQSHLSPKPCFEDLNRLRNRVDQDIKHC